MYTPLDVVLIKFNKNFFTRSLCHSSNNLWQAKVLIWLTRRLNLLSPRRSWPMSRPPHLPRPRHRSMVCMERFSITPFDDCSTTRRNGWLVSRCDVSRCDVSRARCDVSWRVLPGPVGNGRVYATTSTCSTTTNTSESTYQVRTIFRSTLICFRLFLMKNFCQATTWQ